jgi:hypothetical protein
MDHLRARLNTLTHTALRRVGGLGYGSLCVLAALLFGLLNPLLCLIHCQQMLGQGHAGHHHSAASGDQSLFFCQLARQGDGPLAAGVTVPRALYECLTVAAVLIALPLLLARLPRPRPPRLGWLILAPTPPPPEALA